MYNRWMPVVGGIYPFFNDGKIRESRRGNCLITGIVPMYNAPMDVRAWWLRDKKQCDWLYARFTDHFVFGNVSYEWGESEEDHIFARTVDGGWFSLGFIFSGELLEKLPY